MISVCSVSYTHLDVYKRQMQDMGIPLKLIKLTKMAMRFTKAKIKYENMLSESFAFNKGVEQSDGLLASLFIVLHYTIKDFE